MMGEEKSLKLVALVTTVSSMFMASYVCTAGWLKYLPVTGIAGLEWTTRRDKGLNCRTIPGNAGRLATLVQL